LAKPNYQYEKRQKELAKKAKQEEKRRQKQKDAPKNDNPETLAPDAGVAPPEASQP
jgi:hypothetical protein